MLLKRNAEYRIFVSDKAGACQDKLVKYKFFCFRLPSTHSILQFPLSNWAVSIILCLFLDCYSSQAWQSSNFHSRKGLDETVVFVYDSTFEKLKIGDPPDHQRCDMWEEYIERDLFLQIYSMHSLIEKAIFYFQLHNCESDDYESVLRELFHLWQLNHI